MINALQNLYDFVASAERSRIYPTNTAGAMRSALRLLEPELTDEEKESIDTFKSHFEQIFQSTFNKNKSKMSVTSLETYRRRVLALLKDFEKYGNDPTKMASWNRPQRVRKGDKLRKGDQQISKEPSEESTTLTEQSSGMTRFEIALRPDAKAIILTPADITAKEVEQIKGYIDYLAKIAS